MLQQRPMRKEVPPVPQTDVMVTVIPSDVDGAAQRRMQKGLYLRSDGRDDSGAINEAIDRASQGRVYSGLGLAWERIFGKKFDTGIIN